MFEFLIAAWMWFCSTLEDKKNPEVLHRTEIEPPPVGLTIHGYTKNPDGGLYEFPLLMRLEANGKWTSGASEKRYPSNPPVTWRYIAKNQA